MTPDQENAPEGRTVRFVCEIPEGQAVALAWLCGMAQHADGARLAQVLGGTEAAGFALLAALRAVSVELAYVGCEPSRFPWGSPWGMSSPGEVESAGA